MLVGSGGGNVSWAQSGTSVKSGPVYKSTKHRFQRPLFHLQSSSTILIIHFYKETSCRNPQELHFSGKIDTKWEKQIYIQTPGKFEEI